MKCCLYIRGVPGSGKHTVGRLLEHDLGWPMVWVHSFDPIYKAIGKYKVPDLTDKLIRDVASHLMGEWRDFIVVRPSRQTWGMTVLRDAATQYHYKFVVVSLTARYEALQQRVTRRWHESEFRITTAEKLDEYLTERKHQEWEGEHTIDTTEMTPEEVAAKVKELL